jgi:uncharacterized protein YukE
VAVQDGFAVLPSRLSGSGDELALAGRSIDGLGAQLSGDAGIWGSDEEGTAFGGAYSEVAAAAREALTALVDEFASIGDRLTAMAATYAAVDDAERARFEGLV